MWTTFWNIFSKNNLFLFSSLLIKYIMTQSWNKHYLKLPYQKVLIDFNLLVYNSFCLSHNAKTCLL